LISNLDSSVSTLLVSAALGLEEILLRLTIRKRDVLLEKFLMRFFPKYVHVDPDLERRQAVLYADLASMDIVTETACIVIAGALLGLFGGMDPGRVLLDTTLQIRKC
jgi:hypothetical protein